MPASRRSGLCLLKMGASIFNYLKCTFLTIDRTNLTTYNRDIEKRGRFIDVGSGIMGSFLIVYILFMVLALTVGIIFWVRSQYRIPAVLSIIFALLAPLLALLTIAQREGTEAGAFRYFMDQVGIGNTWARMTLIIHIYLIGWLLFLTIRLIIYLVQSPEVKAKYKKRLEQIHKLKRKKEEGT